MKLTPEQETAVREWVAEGARLPDLQRRLREEFSLTLTYLEARMLAGDLELNFATDEPAKAEAPDDQPDAPDADAESEPAALPGEVAVTLDAITRPQALVSGKATFTDGTTVGWHLDHAGRLGLEPPGYRPPDADIPAFNAKLQQLLQKQGF